MTDADAPRIERFEENGVATITIFNPTRANAITKEMKLGLEDAWIWVESNPAIRVAVITGAGDRHFCAGADVNRLANQAQSGHSETANTRFAPRMLPVTKPVIAAVNGAVVGAALGIVADADMIFASTSSYFMDPHVDLGLMSAYSALRFAERVNTAEATRLVLGGRDVRLTAERAHELGFVNEIFDTADHVRQRANSFAQRIAGTPEWAAGQSLHFLRQVAQPVDAIIAEAMQMTNQEWSRPEAQHGTTAWLQSQRNAAE